MPQSSGHLCPLKAHQSSPVTCKFSIVSISANESWINVILSTCQGVIKFWNGNILLQAFLTRTWVTVFVISSNEFAQAAVDVPEEVGREDWSASGCEPAPPCPVAVIQFLSGKSLHSVLLPPLHPRKQYDSDLESSLSLFLFFCSDMHELSNLTFQ